MRRKSVHARGGERLQAGVMCDVEIGVGKKHSMYEARVLGIGEIKDVLTLLYTTSVCVGDKCSMDEMLLEREEETSEETGGTEETERAETEAMGRTGMETGGMEETKRAETETVVEVVVIEDQWEIGGVG